MCAEYSCLAAAICNSATTATTCSDSATTAEEDADTNADAGRQDAAEEEVAPGLLNKSRGRHLWALRVSIARVNSANAAVDCAFVV